MILVFYLDFFQIMRKNPSKRVGKSFLHYSRFFRSPDFQLKELSFCWIGLIFTKIYSTKFQPVKIQQVNVDTH